MTRGKYCRATVFMRFWVCWIGRCSTQPKPRVLKRELMERFQPSRAADSNLLNTPESSYMGSSGSYQVDISVKVAIPAASGITACTADMHDLSHITS
jgi:hypothetical protein